MNKSSIQEYFNLQNAAFLKNSYPSYDQRKRLLAQLIRLLKEQQEEIIAAINKDFGTRSAYETKIFEFFPTLQGIRYILKHLQSWMRPRRYPVSIWFQLGRARVLPQPLGVIGIIVPWNYPILLTMLPLAAALAAGNRVMIKMSELIPTTGSLLKNLFENYFSSDLVTVINGDVTIAQAFTDLPFNHLLFTGSTQVGRQVMQAAAKHLIPVTLELGGKSPAIISDSFPIRKAAEKIMVGKLVNGGQSCIAPDYVLLPKSKLDEFIAEAKLITRKLYPQVLKNSDFTNIISEKHEQRLLNYLSDAQNKGATIIYLYENAENYYCAKRIMPALIINSGNDMLLLQEEIFGPLLPLIPYSSLDEAIGYIQQRAHPLALYYFDYNKKNIEKITQQTLSGGMTVNDTLLHIAQDALPFGGVGASGMGHYHGKMGFDTFSKLKPIFYQSRINFTWFFWPPYNKLINLLLKWIL